VSTSRQLIDLSPKRHLPRGHRQEKPVLWKHRPVYGAGGGVCMPPLQSGQPNAGRAGPAVGAFSAISLCCCSFLCCRPTAEPTTLASAEAPRVAPAMRGFPAQPVTNAPINVISAIRRVVLIFRWASISVLQQNILLSLTDYWPGFHAN